MFVLLHVYFWKFPCIRTASEINSFDLINKKDNSEMTTAAVRVTYTVCDTARVFTIVLNYVN